MAALILISILAGCVGCGTPGSDPAAATPSPSASRFVSADAIGDGQSNTLTSIPNPGSGAGDPALLRALVPQTTYSRLSLPAGLITMPDRDRQSLYIPLRQFSSPVTGPDPCLGWTAGMWSEVVTDFNQPGVELAVTEITPTDEPEYSEAIITGPAGVLDRVADGQIPLACRGELTGNAAYPGSIRVLSTPGAGLGARAFEITGTRAFRIWAWVSVVRGPGFVVEIRIPDQSLDATAGTALPVITAAAYRRALAALHPVTTPIVNPSPVRHDGS
jgi:hypothetical protein